MKNKSLVNRLRRGQKAIGKNEKGYVLVIALLVLAVVTVIGVLALSTSTTEVMIAGNTRLREMNLSSADAGVAVSEPVIRNPDQTKYNFINDVATLRSEIFCTSQMNQDDERVNPNLNITIGENNVSVDIDYINAADPGPGYALEEGGPPVLMKNYRINSTSRGGAGSECMVGATYYIVGYCD